VSYLVDDGCFLEVVLLEEVVLEVALVVHWLCGWESFFLAHLIVAINKQKQTNKQTNK